VGGRCGSKRDCGAFCADCGDLDYPSSGSRSGASGANAGSFSDFSFLARQLAFAWSRHMGWSHACVHDILRRCRNADIPKRRASRDSTEADARLWPRTHP
jgi:hypothetical protein